MGPWHLQVARLTKALDEVQCTSEEHSRQQKQDQEAVAAAGGSVLERRTALGDFGSAADPASGSVRSPPLWLHWTESKVSLALNLAMAVLLSLVLMQPPRRPSKSNRDLQ